MWNITSGTTGKYQGLIKLHCIQIIKSFYVNPLQDAITGTFIPKPWLLMELYRFFERSDDLVFMYWKCQNIFINSSKIAWFYEPKGLCIVLSLKYPSICLYKPILSLFYKCSWQKLHITSGISHYIRNNWYYIRNIKILHHFLPEEFLPGENGDPSK